MAKRLVRENATTTAQQMLLIFALLSPLYEAFSSAMVRNHPQTQPICLQGWQGFSDLCWWQSGSCSVLSISSFQGECSGRLLQTELVWAAFVAAGIGGAAAGTPVPVFTCAELHQGELHHRLFHSSSPGKTPPPLPTGSKHMHRVPMARPPSSPHCHRGWQTV